VKIFALEFFGLDMCEPRSRPRNCKCPCNCRS
jgi:hypothetical protein